LEVKIGVQSVAREVVVETDMTSGEIERALTEALATDGGVLRVTDRNGSRVLVPVATLGYVEIGKSTTKQVGFGS